MAPSCARLGWPTSQEPASLTKPAPSRLLYVEALFAVSTARILVFLLGIRRLGRLATGTAADRSAADCATVTDIRRTIEAWGRRVPFRSKCLEQGVAAAWMLSRRRRPVTLFYGAAMIEGELKAHVWLRSGELDVIGCDNAEDYAVLSQFSNDSSS